MLSIAPTMRRRGRPTKCQPGVSILLDIYLEHCQDKFDIPTRKWYVQLPTTDGFADYLGVHRDSLYRWAKTYLEYKDALERLKRVQHNRLLNGGLSGRYRASFAIFLLKANHGYRVQKRQEVYPKEKLIGVLKHIYGGRAE